MNNGGQISFTIDNNVVSNNAGQGIYVYANGSSSAVTGTVNGNQISNSGGYGLCVLAYNNAVANAITVDGNAISSSDDAGIYVRTYNASQSDVDVTANTVTGSGQDTASSYRYGIWVYTDNSAIAQLWREHRSDMRLAEIRKLSAELEKFSLHIIPRLHNQPADALAKQAIRSERCSRR